MFASYLPYIQIVLSIILIGLIILQHSDATVGAAFGGDSLGGGSGHTRRGPEKIIFITTIVVAVLFSISAFSAQFIH